MLQQKPKKRKLLGIKNGLKIFSNLQAKSTLKNKTKLKKKSTKMTVEEQKWQALVRKLRALVDNHCEICGRLFWGLHGHHVLERSHCGASDESNILMCCPTCHNHQKYPHGIPISRAEAYAIIAKRNERL